ncbi:MAG: hypothetical protein IJ060_03640 [Oscillospiraceae bacterium]|nr:hypothetical protein [Oscillospiraceae bacterium]
MDYLEGFFSILLGIVAGIFIAIGFIISLIVRVLIYLIEMLTALLIPPLRYPIRMHWLLHDADEKKDAQLRTGMLRRVELKGAETDKLFVQMKEAMQTYSRQKNRRAEIKDKTEIKPVFDRIDRLYRSFLKQFYIAANTINWNRTSIYSVGSHPAISNLRTAAEGMEILLNEHEKTINSAISQETGMTLQPEDIAKELEYIRTFNEVQANPENAVHPQPQWIRQPEHDSRAGSDSEDHNRKRSM